MMGDREKCIQAQMDEYLSKPLQQNHLIQTILKCATLGGQLLEEKRERELNPGARREHAPAPAARPPLTNRALTAAEALSGNGLESPALLTADQEDPLNRARTSLSEPNIHRVIPGHHDR
jgi:osomolarity two-component system, sensor histidine kinase NIK1